MKAVIENQGKAAVERQCRVLRLRAVAEQCFPLAEKAVKQRQTYLRYLEAFPAVELEERRCSTIARGIKDAHLPRTKTLDEFDFSKAPQIRATETSELAQGGYIERAEPVILIGDRGTGQTHLLTGLCTLARRQKRGVRFATAAALVNKLVEAKQKLQLRRVRAHRDHYDLIAIDEVGYMPMADLGAEFLFQVIAACAEKAAVIITTNLPFSEWTQVIPNARLCKAEPRSNHRPSPHNRDRNRQLSLAKNHGERQEQTDRLIDITRWSRASATLQAGPIESPQQHNRPSSFYCWARVNFRRWAKISCQTQYIFFVRGPMIITPDSKPDAPYHKGWNSTSYPHPYLLVVGQHLHIYRNRSGQLFTDELWQKDLAMHLEYLDHLMIATPVLHREPPSDAVLLDSKQSRIEIVELPLQAGFLHAILTMPTLVARLWRATSRAGIVHSGVAGWPIPIAWIVTPLVLLCRKPYVVIVESAPWRLPKGAAANWKRRLRASIQELMGRWVISRAELAIFTQDEYKQSLMGPSATRGHVIPASWIDEQNILTDVEAEQVWQRKLAAPDARLKILFVGRLIPDKGVLVLLEALRQLSAGDAPILLSILGEGELKSECASVGSELKGLTSVRVLGTVPYGAPLFELIRDYDALVVPTISDEQPRIVFDAYSQAVPALASDTAGLRSCVRKGETGLFTASNDVKALVALLQFASQHRSELKQLGLRSLKYAHEMTHQEMHRQRVVLLKDMLDKRTRRMGM